MKLNPNFVLRDLDDSAVLVPLGKELLNFNGMLTFNKVGAFLARELQSETTEKNLVERVTEKYDVDKETAKKDVATFLDSLRRDGLIVETAPVEQKPNADLSK